MPNLFYPLSKKEKVDFFVKCQELLIKHHSNSNFIVKESNLEEAADIFMDKIDKYKGYYYFDENVCILWNYVYVSNPNDANGSLIDNAYKEPNANYNAVSMDFVVCRKVSDILKFAKENDSAQVEYLLSIKNGRSKLIKKEDLLKNIKSF
jgi:trehalose-6-phosphatase